MYSFYDIDRIVSDEPPAHGPDHQEQHHRQDPVGEVGPWYLYKLVVHIMMRKYEVR